MRQQNQTGNRKEVSQLALSQQAFQVVRAFRPALKCLLLSTGVGFQPRAGPPFRLFQLPVKPSPSKQWNLRDLYSELLEAEKTHYEEVPPAFRLTGPEAAKIIRRLQCEVRHPIAGEWLV